MTGAICRQGPHHGAQKSTSTGPVAFKTSLSKLLSSNSGTPIGLLSFSASAQLIQVLNYRGVCTSVNEGPVAIRAANGNTGSARACGRIQLRPAAQTCETRRLLWPAHPA